MDDANHIGRDELERKLVACESQTLVSLILRMLQAEPHLMRLLDSVLPNRISPGEEADYEQFRKHSLEIIVCAGHEYHSLKHAAPRFTPLVRMAEGFSQQGDRRASVAALGGIIDGILEEYWNRRDPDFAVGSVVLRCVEFLGECLAKGDGTATMELQGVEILKRVYEYSHRYSYDAFGDAVAKTVRTKVDEGIRRQFAAWLLGQVGKLNGEDNRYERETAARLHLRLVERELSDSEYLAFCRNHELTGDRIDRLLELDRLQEAVKVAASGHGVNLVLLANRLVQRGRGELAEQMLRQDVAAPRARGSRQWLKDWYLARNDLSAALEMTLLNYNFAPDLENYEAVEVLARKVGRWDEVKPSLMARIEERGVHKNSRLEIYLHEDMLPEIAEVAASANANTTIRDDLLLTAARAIEHEFPDQALKIFRRKVSIFAGNYDIAAECLLHMRAIYLRQGRVDEWAAYFHPLRAQHKRKRNFAKALTERGVID